MVIIAFVVLRGQLVDGGTDITEDITEDVLQLSVVDSTTSGEEKSLLNQSYVMANGTYHE